MDAYQQFLERKRMVDPMTGMDDVPELPSFLFPHQRDIVAWSLRRGRAAIFAGTGLGKTAMELVWADEVARYTGKPVLIFAPLAVSQQHIREAKKFGLSARIVKAQDECCQGVNVTNYQKIDHFNLASFGGIVLDESSILKSTDGHYRTRMIEECRSIPFRLAATATPAPNDFMELGNHAEFLGVMSYTDMLATFFSHDGGETQKWRLKGHAENEFWKWMASWAVMLRKPSDLGYPNDGYDLPPLKQTQHHVAVDYAPSMDTGMLFPMEAATLQERIGARRDTVEERVRMAISIVIGSYWDKLAECLGSQNTQLTDAQKLSVIQSMLPNGKQPLGAELPKKIESTCAPITEPTNTNTTNGRKSRGTGTTPPAANDTPAILSSLSSIEITPVLDQKRSNARESCDQPSALETLNTAAFLPCRVEDARYAGRDRPTREDINSTLITVTKQAWSVASCAGRAISGLGNSETIETCLDAQPSISANLTLDRWVIWCQLNSEQDALERALGPLALSVRGSKTDEENERSIFAFLEGDRPILIGKPSMMGFGLNLQCCHQTLFVGLSDSFEQVFQAIRRFWRFGQTKPVNVHFIAAETEGAVVSNLRRKEADAERMAAAMVKHMADLSSQEVRGMSRTVADYNPTQPFIIPSFIGGTHAAA